MTEEFNSSRDFSTAGAADVPSDRTQAATRKTEARELLAKVGAAAIIHSDSSWIKVEHVYAAISEALARAEAAEKSAAERLVTIQVMEAAHIITRSKLSEAEAVIAPFAALAPAMDYTHHRDGDVVHRQEMRRDGVHIGWGELREDDFLRAAAFKAEG